MRTNYLNYTLDPFQREAMDYVAQGRSVIVSAPTGVGKTLVADYLVEQVISAGQKAVYTAPIKALSNQKYKEFKARFGADRVGLVTGDISINPRGDILIMTTEIFRNMVLAQEPFLQEISHVIFDEVHYIDSERGVAWEESIIFAPPHVRILGLSATIGNLEQLSGWLSEVRSETFAVVVENRRVVPLEHHFFYESASGEKVVASFEASGEFYLPEHSKADHLDLVEHIRKEHLPALFFVFSRRQCAEKAREASQSFQLLTRDELQAVEEALLRYGSIPGLQGSGDYRLLRSILRKGVGYHHAGLLPVLKDMVEELFAERLIKVLYCTETFSVGINYPVRTVCFDGQRKYDGRSVRLLKAQEYYQMAGRAGRRGMDERGYVFTLVNDRFSKVENYSDRQLERLNSQFHLTFNSVLNLLKHVAQENIDVILQKSFAGYLSTADRRRAENEYERLKAQKDLLEEKVCAEINDICCPVTYAHRKRRLKTYEGLLRKCNHRNIALRDKHETLKKEIEATRVKPCPHTKRNNCKRLKKAYNQALTNMYEANERLKAIPALNVHFDEFQSKVRVLEQLSYVEQGALLARGEVASRIYIQELLVTELIFAGVLEDLTEEELVALFVGVDYPWRKFDTVLPIDGLKLHRWTQQINRLQSHPTVGPSMVYSSYLAPLGFRWARGDELKVILDNCNLDEGDIVGLLRREIDLFRQMRHALSDAPHLVDKLSRCINLIDRDLVKVEL
jgi:superfamily II RNA helicase